MEKQRNKLGLPAFLRRDREKSDTVTVKEERKPWTTRSIVKKIFWGVVAVLAAMLLWGYVLLMQNPDRQKTFSGVEVRLEPGSEADLLYKNLMVYGNISDILKDVSVTVSAPLNDIAKLDPADITASVNFNEVHGSGVTSIQIRATTPTGTVVSVDPSTIEVDIDDVTTRAIAVDQVFEGELAEGLWHGTPTVSPRSINIKGARRDVERIKSAVCVVDLSELTESINYSVLLRLVDEDGETVDSAVLMESIPAVNVQMQVLPYKQVDIRYTIEDELDPGLVIESATLSTEQVTIACEEETLAALKEIDADAIFIGDITTPGVYEKTLTLTLSGIPDDAVIIDNTNLRSVKLTLIVREVKDTKVFENVGITLTGRRDGYGYTFYIPDENGDLGEALTRLAADITVYGPRSAVNVITGTDLMLLLDVSGRAAGTYDLPLRLVWNSALAPLADIEFPQVVRVVITLQQP